MFKVHSKVTFQSFSYTLLNTYVSCSTKCGECAWQSLTCHIENTFEHQKAFSLQIKARVNQRKIMIQKKISVLIRKKRMRIEGNRKNQEITSGCVMKRRQCSAIFVGNLRGQTPLHQQKGVQISVHLKIKMSPKILAKETNCPPVIKSQLKPWTYVHPLPQGPLIKDLYRRHKNTKSSAFPSTIYHIVRPLVREGHSHEGATKFQADGLKL